MTANAREPLAEPLDAIVLLAEDDASVRAAVARELRGRFSEVLESDLGGETFGLFARERPDAVVAGLDGGLALAEAVHAEDPAVPIVLTGHPRQVLAVLETVPPPHIRFLVKPYAARDLGALLSEALGVRQARTQADEAGKLMKSILDISPNFQALFQDGRLVRINQNLLRFMGVSTFFEYKDRGLSLEGLIPADARPPAGLTAFVRSITDDPLDRDHYLKLASPNQPGLPPVEFKAAAAALPGRDTHLLTLTDISELENEKRVLTDMALLDPLTRAYNRRKILGVLADEMARAIRYGHTLCVILCDIDHFKRINDTFGHDVGDTVLVEFAQAIAQGIRTNDTLARWGGEEFLVVVPEAGLPRAVELAQRLRRDISGRDFAPAGRVSASFGVAEFRPGQPVEALLKRVDQALYRAKAAGRDRVEADDAPPDAV